LGVSRCTAPSNAKKKCQKREQKPLSKKLYVGNLSFNSTEDDIRTQFATYGEVISVNLITDRETGRLRGFGFVEMDEEGARAAIQGMDGKDFGGRNLKVNEAEDKPRSGGGGRGDRRW
jgi:RNA recognition motif-containing protein